MAKKHATITVSHDGFSRAPPKEEGGGGVAQVNGLTVRDQSGKLKRASFPVPRRSSLAKRSVGLRSRFCHRSSKKRSRICRVRVRSTCRILLVSFCVTLVLTNDLWQGPSDFVFCNGPSLCQPCRPAPQWKRICLTFLLGFTSHTPGPGLPADLIKRFNDAAGSHSKKCPGW